MNMANNYQSPFDFLTTFGKLWAQKQEQKKEVQKALTFNEMAKYYLSTQRKQPESPALTTATPPIQVGVPEELAKTTMTPGTEGAVIRTQKQPLPATMEEFDWAETMKFINASNLLGPEYGNQARNLSALKMQDAERRYQYQKGLYTEEQTTKKNLKVRKQNLIDDLTNDYQAEKISKEEYEYQVQYVKDEGEIDYKHIGKPKLSRLELHRVYGEIFTPKSLDRYLGTGNDSDLEIVDSPYKIYLNKYKIIPNNYTINSLIELWNAIQVNPDVNPWTILKEKPKPIELTDKQKADQAFELIQIDNQRKDIKTQIRNINNDLKDFLNKGPDKQSKLNKDKAELNDKLTKLNREYADVDENYLEHEGIQPFNINDKKYSPTPNQDFDDYISFLTGTLTDEQIEGLVKLYWIVE